MPFITACPYCSTKSRVPDDSRGWSIPCPKCGSSFTVVPLERDERGSAEADLPVAATAPVAAAAYVPPPVPVAVASAEADRQEQRRRRRLALLLALLALVPLIFWANCRNTTDLVQPAVAQAPAFENGDGLKLTPPKDFSERNRPNGKSPIKTERTFPFAAENKEKSDARENVLVQYRRMDANAPAWITVTVVDAPKDVNLNDWLARRPVPEGYRFEQPGVEECDMDGTKGVRARYKGYFYEKHVMGDVRAMMNGGKIYIFSGFFLDDDLRTEENIDKAFREAGFAKSNTP